MFENVTDPLCHMVWTPMNHCVVFWSLHFRSSFFHLLDLSRSASAHFDLYLLCSCRFSTFLERFRRFIFPFQTAVAPASKIFLPCSAAFSAPRASVSPCSSDCVCVLASTQFLNLLGWDLNHLMLWEGGIDKWPPSLSCYPCQHQ